MAAVRKKNEEPVKEARRVPWALLGAILFGGMAILIFYVVFFAPDEGMLSGMRGVIQGLCGSLMVLAPAVFVWLCVLSACRAAGKRVAVWRVIANMGLILCLYSAVELFFLEGVERGDKYCLEGFLFPDTYDFYKNSDPRDVLEKMLDNFSNRFNDDLRSQIDSLNYRISEAMRAEGKSEDQIARSLFTVRDVVITASLIEKETSGDDESPMISSVIFNRLFRWGGNPAYLNIDAAIVYALEGKTDLTAEDLRVDSPYNTYLHTGLTPGAISNPGLASLKAALNPADTNYFYYVLDPSTGSHKFSVTLDEHNAFIAALR